MLISIYTHTHSNSYSNSNMRVTSERSNKAGTKGIRLKEGASINRSLVTLGSVITALGMLHPTPSSSSPYLPSYQ